MNSCCLLVLSRYADLFNSFRESVDILAPDAFKILIRSGSDIKAPDDTHWLTEQGREPFNFSRSVNQGFSAAGMDDVCLCGDDIRIQTPDFLHILQEVAYSDPAIGFCVPELGGQSAFVCAYIKRELITATGLMDERFTGYGYQDNDYYRRFEAIGYRTQPTTRVIAQHSGGTSYYRAQLEGGPSVGEQADHMRKLYEEKWGQTR